MTKKDSEYDGKYIKCVHSEWFDTNSVIIQPQHVFLHIPCVMTMSHTSQSWAQSPKISSVHIFSFINWSRENKIKKPSIAIKKKSN